MDCGTLTTNQQQLQSMVLEWQAKAMNSSITTEVNNANSIVQILQGRLDEYDRLIALNCNQMATTNNGTVQPVPEQSPTNGGSIMLPLLLVAGGIFFLSRMKKRRKQRTNRKR